MLKNYFLFFFCTRRCCIKIVNNLIGKPLVCRGLSLVLQSGLDQTPNAANGFRQQTEQKRSKRCEGRVFSFSHLAKVTRTQGPDLESEHTATLGRLQWPSCRAHSQVGPLSHRRLIQGDPRPHKKEIWLPVTQRRSLFM